ncbi:MAG: alanine racemase [Paraglaciecola sp.]|nr:alanine racemase [Paraglaciecola sp.]
MSRPTQIIIDLPAIRHNCQIAARLAPHAQVVAMVKADAYGHGATQVAKALEPQVAKFGVCCIEEAQTLRQAGVNKPIVLIEGCFSAEEYQLAAQINCELLIHTEQQISQLLASKSAFRFTIWLKLDTGMHRLGIDIEKTAAVVQALQASNKIEKLILTSHFASADELNGSFTSQQMFRFEQVVSKLKALNAGAFDISLANSAAVLAWPQSHQDWIRPGIMLYGISPFSDHQQQADELVPVMHFCSKVIALREVKQGEYVGYGNTWQAKRSSVIATIAAGYGDGYPRTAPSGTPVLIKGHRAELAGRVSMDMLSVDVTDLTAVEIGDHVELWGAALDVNEVARFAGTNGYELVTRMPPRAKRFYL